MALDTGLDHDESPAHRHVVPSAAESENSPGQSIPVTDEPIYPSSLLDNSSAKASYNSPVRQAVIQQLQQTEGNQALQRRLAGGDQTQTSSYGERAVQRWQASREARHSDEPHDQASPDPEHTTALQRKKIASTPEQTPTPITLQLKSIKQGDNVVGEYDSLGGLESSYQSSWEGEKKSVGVSYHMVNARRMPGNVPVATAVAHAHVTRNGQLIDGVSVKDAPGGGGGQWVRPDALNSTTKAEIINDMKAQTPNPIEVTNIRKVSMVTGHWTPPHQSVPTTNVFETIFIALPGGFVEEKKVSADLIYDIATGKYLKTDMYATKKEAQEAADRMPEPVAATPVPTTADAPDSTEAEEEEETGETTVTTEGVDKAAVASSKKAEKRRRQRERQKAMKATATSESVEPSSTPAETTATPPVQAQAGGLTAKLREWIDWIYSEMFITNQ